MDLITQCFTEHDRTMMKRLVNEAFSIDQASRFLPAAQAALSRASQNTSVFQTIACLFSNTPYQLPRILDLNAIADGTGVDTEKVKAGLHAIAPVLLMAYAEKYKDHTRSPVTPATESR